MWTLCCCDLNHFLCVSMCLCWFQNAITFKNPLSLGQDQVSSEIDASETLAKDLALNIREKSTRIDSRPVTHWGSHKGMILSASVLDNNGNHRDVFRHNTLLNIRVDICLPSDLPRDHLSIAVSIKDLKGTDIIVSTTFEQSKRRLPDEDLFAVVFSLTNCLVRGKYLLVAAVENRQNRDIHYYEYLEGAHYFATECDENYFGLVQPSISQTILRSSDSAVAMNLFNSTN